MNKKFVFVAAFLTYCISLYFSYSFFTGNSSSGSLRIMNQGGTDKVDVTQAVADGEEQIPGKLTEECPLNGLKLTETHKKRWEARRPMGIMIENHLEARPQSGLTSADVVYEFVAEGGITRFLTMFYCKDARYVGPVRSARVYFVEMVRGYGNNPLYVHVGGANHPGKADALGMISKLKWAGYNDLNQFSVPFPIFARDYERLPGVATEHTMYSSTQKLWKYAADKRKLAAEDEDGVKWDEDFETWEFKDGKASSSPTAPKISYDYWEGRADYAVSWNYDAATNTYKRFQNGKPHEDKNNKKQLYAFNVVVASMKESPANDGYDGGHLLYKTLGSGKAVVFQNGEAVEGTWKKPKEEDMIRFFDKSGKEIELVRGLTWVSAIPEGNEVTY
ncbi:DUF3048 domain-containing protein [Candidatus Woesebacteria bacterium]|nr:DUF3048 domain-containing protein [Candidatus Woesebacteria bacterium]